MAKSKKKLKRSSKWMLSLVAIIILLMTVYFMNQSTSTKGFKIEAQPHLGEETAPVEIIQFGDYKCPSCKTFTESFFPLIQDELIATGKARFYFVNDPFIQADSKRAAEFAETVYHELGNDVFWQFHHVLYEQQPKDKELEKQEVYTPKFLIETLSGLVSEEDTNQVIKAFKKGAGEGAVKTDRSFADEMNVSGTPALFVDGKRFKGSTISELKEMVDQSTNE
ncbi:thioredoxin domain-containing protein [Pseudalkalibacillus hwajinpoensis]|uniref:DsbA family protein n=1 Tax=Guptibacillus hwajinpoensis TaxID=208199 RepID=UPI00325A5475